MHAVEALLAAADALDDRVLRHRAFGHRAAGRHPLRRAAALAHPGTLRPPLAAAARPQPGPAGRPVPAVRGNGRSRPGVVPAAAAPGGGARRAGAGCGCGRPPSPCSIGPSPTAGRSTAPTASSTPPTGTGGRWSGTGCTGWSPRASPRPPPCTQRTGERPLRRAGRRPGGRTRSEYLFDRERGSWHHQLDAQNRVIGTVWPGKPDLYHAVQATLIPRLPLAPSMATALAAGPPMGGRDLVVAGHEVGVTGG